ncbi:hypothetical protein RHM65_20745 [Pseudomonas sp. CCI4.2]|uniref:hypothetical protein n=1 Tax=Pseudomonas sp. CCI4.2 TaxID=3048620 RepID=UPI002AC91737|nr:hypothetical protein [Pseudomonas sp. CCI4.2]MEB0091297.1 hypothetical protein [Pseudomonas sp. CCI4.2]WPX53196.1 hypothetical protein RHM65_20745 [Pseudomonas sp. CCI4.2]
MSLASPEPSQVKRMGFMVGQIVVPDDFDQMGSEEIEYMFRPIGSEHAVAIDSLPLIHKDPLIAFSWPKPPSRVLRY